MDKPWFKLYTEIAMDPKVCVMPHKQRWQLIALLCLAGKCDKDGLIDMREDEIALVLEVKEEELAAIRKEFIYRGFLADDPVVWFIANWNKRQRSWKDAAKRQPDSTASYETLRKRVYRERKRREDEIERTNFGQNNLSKEISPNLSNLPPNVHGTYSGISGTNSGTNHGADKPKSHAREAIGQNRDNSRDNNGTSLYKDKEKEVDQDQDHNPPYPPWGNGMDKTILEFSSSPDVRKFDKDAEESKRQIAAYLGKAAHAET